MTFGKYKSWMYKEVPTAYMEWSIKEVAANSNPCPELKQFATWAQDHLAKRDQQAKASGLINLKDDPETNAVIPPPWVADGSETSVATWKTEASTVSRAAAAGSRKAKRDAETIDVDNMDSQPNEEVQQKLTELETQAAIIRRDHRMPTGGTSK